MTSYLYLQLSVEGLRVEWIHLKISNEIQCWQLCLLCIYYCPSNQKSNQLMPINVTPLKGKVESILHSKLNCSQTIDLSHSGLCTLRVFQKRDRDRHNGGVDGLREAKELYFVPHLLMINNISICHLPDLCVEISNLCNIITNGSEMERTA